MEAIHVEDGANIQVNQQVGDHVPLQAAFKNLTLQEKMAEIAIDLSAKDKVLWALSVAHAIGKGQEKDTTYSFEMGELAVMLRDNRTAMDAFIAQASALQGIDVAVDKANGERETFNRMFSKCLWPVENFPVMHTTGSAKSKQTLGAKRITAWIRAYEGKKSDSTGKAITVTQILAHLLYNEICLSHVLPEMVSAALREVYGEEKVTKWAASAKTKAFEFGLTTATKQE